MAKGKNKTSQKKKRSSEYYAKKKQIEGGSVHLSRESNKNESQVNETGVTKHTDFVRFYGVPDNYYKALNWARLVEQTRANEKFSNDYTFALDQSWVSAKPFGDWCAAKTLPAVIAIDCEMCECMDPVTQQRENTALIRFSAVDGYFPSQAIFDSLVLPSNPISDMRTKIHGISESHLTDVKFTLRHAQAAMLDLCTDQTIIIGHSVHKDLKALRFSHSNVIDTAYLYKLVNEPPTSSPSVRDVSEQILGVKLSNTHNSLQDARASLFAAAQLLIPNPRTEVVRGIRPNSVLSKVELFVHRIPSHCEAKTLHDTIVSITKITPKNIGPITRISKANASNASEAGPAVQSKQVYGKAVVEFTSKKQLDLAFEKFTGVERLDNQNRQTKKVSYLGGFFFVCKSTPIITTTTTKD
jgi:DNA polymerase III epsilon subunit-like protein